MALCCDLVCYVAFYGVKWLMWRYVAFCGDMWRYVALGAARLSYVVLCGVLWCYVGL